MRQLVLSLFPGIGLLDMAFEEAGFCVVRGPDLLWGGDVRCFHAPAGRFDGIIGGPPCQMFSTMRHLEPRAGAKHGNLIPEFERIVADAKPAWFLMENVRDAPLPRVRNYQIRSQLLRDVHCGGETTRLRRFSFGSADGLRLDIETLALCRPDPEPAALACGGRREKPRVTNTGDIRRFQEGFKTARDYRNHCRLQGVPETLLDHSPFTIEGKIRALGNGVPLAMGRAVASAVSAATSGTERAVA